MRLDARANTEYHYWQVYHATRCAVLRNVIWIDTESRQWCEDVSEPGRGEDEALVVRQAKHIFIIPGKQFIIIDPLDTREHNIDIEAARLVRGLAAYTRPTIGDSLPSNLFGGRVEVYVGGIHMGEATDVRLNVIPDAVFPTTRRQGGRRGR